MIHIVVALPAEAKPLVDHFDLQRWQANTAYPLYHGDHKALVVTGVGKAAAAAGVTFLHNVFDTDREVAWLNVGVAGHGIHPLGSGFLAHTITDDSNGQRYYPPPVLPFATPRESLITVDTPSAEYPDSALVDMEASGFYATASSLTTSELVQCFKVVSDNKDSPANNIDATRVTALIRSHLKTIQEIVITLDHFSTHLQALRKAPQELELFQQRWRFTVSEKHQLRKLLRRWQVLAPKRSAWSCDMDTLKKAKDVLTLLRVRVESQLIRFDTLRRD